MAWEAYWTCSCGHNWSGKKGKGCPGCGEKATVSKVPSVTTVLKLIGDKNGLLFWANNEGLEGRRLYEDTTPMTVGTLAHLAIEADIKGQPFSLDDLEWGDVPREQVEKCIGAWHEWREQTRLEIIASEEKLWHPELRFAGTLDCAAVHRRTSILDLKTGSGIYPEYLAQIRAYGELWNVNHPEQPITEYHLLRLGKEDGSFHHHRYSAEALELSWDLFKAALEVNRVYPTLKKQAA